MSRALLVLIAVVAVALVLGGVAVARRRRRSRHGVLPALPATPEHLGAALLRASGRYVGTSYAASGRERVVHAGLGAQASADADLYATGLVLHRRGSSTIFIPSGDWIEARLAPALADKATGDGLLVLRWRLGDTEVDTGFRADDTAKYPEWVHAINEQVAA
jgi:hypothetical protein